VYCENCRDESSPFHIPKEAIRNVFKKPEPATIVIDVKDSGRWKSWCLRKYERIRSISKIFFDRAKKIYKQVREKTMAKIEVVKSRSWFLINVLGQKVCKSHPELFEHFKDNKPVKLTVETVDEPVVVSNDESFKTIEDFPDDEEIIEGGNENGRKKTA
jgi:hypothetical protein